MAEGGDGSITAWIGDLKAGDPAALEQIWARYFERLATMARRRLQSGPRGVPAVDGEDAASSALNSLWERASGGKLPELRDRDELWRLLVVITARKAMRVVERERTQKRGGGRVVDQAALALASEGNEAGSSDLLARVAGSEPTPEFVAMIAEEVRNRLEALPDPSLREVARLRMEGYSQAEIAGRIGCVVRTVERKLDVIRKLWSIEGDA